MQAAASQLQTASQIACSPGSNRARSVGFITAGALAGSSSDSNAGILGQEPVFY